MYRIEPKRHQLLLVGLLGILLPAVSPPLANDTALQRLENEFRKVVAEARPAMVKVIATWAASISPPSETEKLMATRQNISSGIVIDAAGHVVTTTFEREAPDTIVVIFNDGKVSPAELIGSDPFTDIVVLRTVDARLTARAPQKSKTAAPLKSGDSSKIDTGSWVITIGSSYGQSPIVSFGIVGGWDRLPNHSCSELIKINAAVTPGNGGGAVVNTSGEIVGMILAVLAEMTGTNPTDSHDFQRSSPHNITQFLMQSLPQEITFAIPIETVQTVAKEIIEHGKVARGWLGVEVTMGQYGVFVKDVIPGSPAHKSGLLPKDVILEFNEVPVHSYTELLRCVVNERPETQVQLKIGRGGTEQHHMVILGEK